MASYCLKQVGFVVHVPPVRAAPPHYGIGSHLKGLGCSYWVLLDTTYDPEQTSAII